MEKILCLHGPNLNLLGTREPARYGSLSLHDINTHLTKQAQNLRISLSIYQSNAEHLLLEQIHNTIQEHTDFIIFNPGAFTHTSIALRDALLAVNLPFIEVHLSNIFARETFRQHSYFSDIAVGVISGLGAHGYELALEGAHYYLKHKMKR